MNQINVLELGLRDPSRLTAHLAGRTRRTANQPHTAQLPAQPNG